LLVTGYLTVIAFVVVWPIALLQMLPVRIAVHRASGQYEPVWAMAFFSVITIGVLWVIALVVALRDRSADLNRLAAIAAS
jgi:hypothetical protein